MDSIYSNDSLTVRDVLLKVMASALGVMRTNSHVDQNCLLLLCQTVCLNDDVDPPVVSWSWLALDIADRPDVVHIRTRASITRNILKNNQDPASPRFVIQSIKYGWKWLGSQADRPQT